jgi:hypothetical protein
MLTAELFEKAKQQARDRAARFDKLDYNKLLAERQKLQEAIQKIDDQLDEIAEEMGISTSPAKAKPGIRKGGKRHSITIDDVVATLKSGPKNYREVASELGCSTANVRAKVQKEGKAAGIGSTGERASFKLMLTGDQSPGAKEKGAKGKG